MLTIVQLEDGCYKVTVDISIPGCTMHREWVFRTAESDALPLDGGERLVFTLTKTE